MSNSDELQIVETRVLKGPNIWAYRPVIEVLLQLGRFEELPSNKLLGFTDRLTNLVPSLYNHRCSEGHPGGFFERLREGTWMGHVLEHLVLELQSLAGMDCGFGKTRSTSRYGEYRMVFEYKDEEAARRCLHLGREILLSCAAQKELPFSLQQQIEEIRNLSEDNMLGPSTRAIVEAARKRHIPWYRLTRNGSLIQLGYGARARRIQAAETSLTSNIAVEIASDKEMTKALLAKAGVPVPSGEVVRDEDEAWSAAQSLGLPVVVKPADGNQGRAVSVNLETEESVRRAFRMAKEVSRSVIVERFLTGNDYRLLVVGGQVVAAAQRRPAQVVADGTRTIRELVLEANEDPRRGNGHGCALTRIRMDAAADLTLHKQLLDWDMVPEAGRVVFLRDCSNLSTGGTATDVTDEVHPENAKLAVLAARVIGLDIAGIDVLCENIRRPLKDQDGGIIEVNAAPGLRMHSHPSQGRPRRVGEAIVNMLFPEPDRAKIPLIAVTGTNGKTTVTRMIGHIFCTTDAYVGMATTDGVYFDGVRQIKGDCSGPWSAEAVLQHPLVEVAVLETARGGILRQGLAWDRSTVSVVLNVADDHLGIGGIETREDLARVKRVVVEGVDPRGYGVLNADDPLVAEMAGSCPGSIIFFSRDFKNPVVSAHLAKGGRAVYLQDNEIVLAEGSEESFLIRSEDIPATMGGLIPFQVQNAMAAAAAAWGAGVSWHFIRHGLRTFQSDAATVPGRFNIFEYQGARILIDYAHNPHALAALTDAVSQIATGRRICVLGAPGDRRDADLEELGELAGRAFDSLIIREDLDPRGRNKGEVAAMLQSAASRVRQNINAEIILHESEAVRRAVEIAQPEDIVVVLADDVDEVLAFVQDLTAREAAAGPRPSFHLTFGAEAAGPFMGPYRLRNPDGPGGSANGRRGVHDKSNGNDAHGNGSDGAGLALKRVQVERSSG